jgi:hypothetical protein
MDRQDRQNSETERHRAALLGLLALIFVYAGLADDTRSAMSTERVRRAMSASREAWTLSRRICRRLVRRRHRPTTSCMPPASCAASPRWRGRSTIWRRRPAAWRAGGRDACEPAWRADALPCHRSGPVTRRVPCRSGLLKGHGAMSTSFCARPTRSLARPWRASTRHDPAALRLPPASTARPAKFWGVAMEEHVLNPSGHLPALQLASSNAIVR